MTQPLITNYFGQPATGHTLEANPPTAFIRTHMVYTAESDEEFSAKFQGGIRGPLAGGAFGRLTLYQDADGGWWLNHIEVAAQVRQNGVARKLCEAAIERHGHLYASNSQNDPGGETDTRHLSEEGAILVNRLIHHGVMRQDWKKAPVV